MMSLRALHKICLRTFAPGPSGRCSLPLVAHLDAPDLQGQAAVAAYPMFRGCVCKLLQINIVFFEALQNRLGSGGGQWSFLFTVERWAGRRFQLIPRAW